MTILSLIAFVFGVVGVWLTIKQTIWCWPVSIISVIASVIEFYKEHLFGDMFLQIVYFFSALYGWYFWNKQKSNHEFSVTKMPSRFLWRMILITFAQSLIYYYLLINFKGDRPLFDGILTAASLTATYMMTRKWIENWLTWVLIDSAYVILYGIKFMWLFALLYLFFTFIAFFGWIKWRKTVS